ncbi:MAG: right-handed parallel beta-helix repeat-containing protein, partial [Thermoplasmata archaeon]|nr:right-handed parallel beta-helix repeat-containing protein [Thermoplasmata archaeon]
MKCRHASTFVGVVLIVSMFSFVLIVVPDVARATILYVGGSGPGNYSSIRVAINTASPGDTIYIFKGTYYENIEIPKPLTLIGEERDSTTIYSGTDRAIRITSNWVNVTGLTVTGYELNWHPALISIYADNCLIANNRLLKNPSGDGIDIYESDFNIILNNILLGGDDGINLYFSENNALINNTITGYGDGISLDYSNDNTIIRNEISSNVVTGIVMYQSLNNVFVNNTMDRNGMYIIGTKVKYWNSHFIHVSNRINGKPLYYWKDADGGSIPPGAGGVILANSTNVVVENQDVSNGSVGILMGYSSGSIIANNTANYSRMSGIHLYNSEKNVITNNTVAWNDRYGLYLRGVDNIVMHNALSHNTRGVQ